MGLGSNESNAPKLLAESIRRFCRSIELCDGYLRGYYGLKLVSPVMHRIRLPCLSFGLDYGPIVEDDTERPQDLVKSLVNNR